MNEVRRKGTIIGYTFSYAQFEAEWDLMLEANPELTETERQEDVYKRQPQDDAQGHSVCLYEQHLLLPEN